MEDQSSTYRFHVEGRGHRVVVVVYPLTEGSPFTRVHILMREGKERRKERRKIVTKERGNG